MLTEVSEVHSVELENIVLERRNLGPGSGCDF
jgi:hypothetical protein